MDTNKQGLIVMYHEIKKLYNIEHFSVRKIARHLNINFRTVQKYLDMNQEDFDNYLEQKFEKSYLLDPFRDFIISYISKYEDAPASVVHDRLKENFTAFPRLDDYSGDIGPLFWSIWGHLQFSRFHSKSA